MIVKRNRKPVAFQKQKPGRDEEKKFLGMTFRRILFSQLLAFVLRLGRSLKYHQNRTAEMETVASLRIPRSLIPEIPIKTKRRRNVGKVRSLKLPNATITYRSACTATVKYSWCRSFWSAQKWNKLTIPLRQIPQRIEIIEEVEETQHLATLRFERNRYDYDKVIFQHEWILIMIRNRF